MADATFDELLTETAQIERPVVELDAEGGPRTPTCQPTGESVRVRIADARTLSERGLLGRAEDVTHVIYARIADLRAADRLVTRPVTTALAEDVEAGESTLPVEATDGIRDGMCVELGAQEMTVRAVGAGELTVTPPTNADHEAGESVRVIERYLVMAVEDAAGAGHHLRIAAKALQGR